MPESAFEEILAARLAAGDTGALDVRDGRRRWIVFLDGGRITAVRSNLKSDQLDALRAARPDLSARALRAAQVARVLLHALKAEAPQVAFKSGARSPEAADLPTPRLLHRALARARSVEALEGALGPVLDGSPAFRGPAAPLGQAALDAFLQGLDGVRTGREAADFASGPRGEVLAALWVAWKLDWLDLGAAPARPSARPAGSLDLAALIAEGLAEGDDGASPDGRPPRSAAPDTGPEAAVAEMPAPAPSQGTGAAPGGVASPLDGPSYEVGAPPRRRGTPAREPSAGADGAPAEDPAFARVRELHDRISVAENHFQVLGLTHEAGPDEIREAHLRLAAELHPDRLTGAPEAIRDMATEAFDRVRAAWEELRDDERRAAYIDHAIHGRKTEDELAMEQVQNYWAAEADFKRGLAAFHAGRIKPAHEMFTAAVERVPDELEFRAYWAYTTWVTHRGTDPERAEAGFEALKEVLDKNKDQERKLDMAWVLLGRIYRDKGEDRIARRCFVQALRINASNADATREMRRLSGGEGGRGDAKSKKKAGGLLGGLFGRKRKD